jgi:ubiquinone/menaquinone biosynthesis C-methylase UbiE
LDPSQLAINKAKESNRGNASPLNFDVGTATSLPYFDEMFDLVFFGFCLYLIPPSETYTAIMEANRVVKHGGFIAILDFDYGSLKINPYKHTTGVFSYKNNYSKIFLSSSYYSLVSKWSFTHTSEHFTHERDNRISIEIFYKELI